jgi:hypothetical protein
MQIIRHRRAVKSDALAATSGPAIFGPSIGVMIVAEKSGPKCGLSRSHGQKLLSKYHSSATPGQHRHRDEHDKNRLAHCVGPSR